MWLVAKFKKNELGTFKRNLKEKLKSNLIFYQPKFLKESSKRNKKIFKEIPLIGNYVFIFHRELSKSSLVNFLSSTKGLEYFLEKSILSQSQINNFINSCKNFEDCKGYIKPNYFKNLLDLKARFLSGPFINQVFQVIEKKENYMKIIMNDLEIKFSDKTNYLYRPL